MSSTEANSLAQVVATTVERLSAPALASLIVGLRAGLSRESLRNLLPVRAYEALVDDLVQAAVGVPGVAVALALESVAQSCQRSTQISLVWTGPTTSAVPVRRTDQALLQLINGASRRVIVVSFAVYKVPNVAATLEAAGRRGVMVDLIVESEEASGGKISFDGWRNLGRDSSHFRRWTWATERRPVTPSGRVASLHAKCAVADGERLLVSSANLTEFALDFNMELGVLLHRGEIPGRVERHFDALMNAGELTTIPW